MGQENREGRQAEEGGNPSLPDKWKSHSWTFKHVLLEGGVIFPLPDLASVTFLKQTLPKYLCHRELVSLGLFHGNPVSFHWSRHNHMTG